LERLKSWRKIAPLRNFAGTVAYNTEFVLPNELVRPDLLWQLELGQVFETARVLVNGAEAGVVWSPPYRIDVTPLLQPGKNTLRIEVANLLKNHLDKSPEYARPSGLLGSVMLTPQRERLIFSPEATRSGGATATGS
jgi:hypothetical protein